jgi:hypothetical protein
MAELLWKSFIQSVPDREYTALMWNSTFMRSKLDGAAVPPCWCETMNIRKKVRIRKRAAV